MSEFKKEIRKLSCARLNALWVMLSGRMTIDQSNFVKKEARLRLRRMSTELDVNDRRFLEDICGDGTAD